MTSSTLLFSLITPKTQSIYSSISENESPEINESSEVITVNKNFKIITTDENLEIINENSEITTVNKKWKRNKSQSWIFKEGPFIQHDPQNGTSALIRHIKNTKCKKYLKVDESQQILQLSTLGLVTYKFFQKRSCQDLSKMIIIHTYPFRMAEHEGFLTFVNNLQPQIKVMSAKTTCEDCKDIIKDLKVKVHMMIQETPGNLNYMTDLWTSN
ncbi:4540_t:CDS:2 [Diversispora eburnea]|uniref:4540_t:CDS:1 n=1 Tax=Diversispora eburnea TaxID=1213867 RepID=A0A9N9CSX5_9GLOM|nr:4540_t:CDS:2 [Diversispora eburnea]